MHKGKVVIRTLLAGCALATMLQSANAACTGFTGVWNFYAFEVHPGTTATGNIIECAINLAADGTFTGNGCKSWQLGQSGNETTTVTGKIMNTSCSLSGTIKPQSDKLVTIQAGHVNGSIAAGIATQGTGTATRLMNFTLVRN